MISGFQCTCGISILHGEGFFGEIVCPNCGAKFSENSVTLFDGTTYYLEKNGRWVRGLDVPKRPSIQNPTSRFFRGEEFER